MSIAPPPQAAPQPIEHYENFPVASFLCPAHLRAPIAAIYHFARTADDIADEGHASPSQRLEQLADYRRELEMPHATSVRWPQVFGPLHRVIQTHQLPLQLLHDLLDAFVQDVEKTRDGEGYADDAELLDYCRRSANPVGRLLLHLYGVTEEAALQESDAICTALQLINFWQDFSVDLPRGRFYVPQSALLQFGLSHADFLAQEQSKNATTLIAHYAISARARMLNGSGLVHKVPGRTGWELRLVVQGGLRILDKIEALNYATLNQRPTLSKWDAPVILWRALWM